MSFHALLVLATSAVRRKLLLKVKQVNIGQYGLTYSGDSVVVLTSISILVQRMKVLSVCKSGEILHPKFRKLYEQL
jgi:hypothetical protein